jgi:hypothetical protein
MTLAQYSADRDEARSVFIFEMLTAGGIGQVVDTLVIS